MAGSMSLCVYGSQTNNSHQDFTAVSKMVGPSMGLIPSDMNF